jgi:hypothetical protein
MTQEPGVAGAPAGPRGTSSSLVPLEIAVFAVVFIAGGVLAWLGLFGDGASEIGAAQSPPVGTPPIAGPTAPGGGAPPGPSGSTALAPLSRCLEAAGFAVEDNSEVHPETLGSLRITRGPELLFVFVFGSPEEATAFQEGFGPDAPLVVNLGRVIVEYTSPPSPDIAEPVETCSEPFA